MSNNNVSLEDYLQRFSTKALWHFTGYEKSEEDAYERLVLITKNKLLKISKNPVPIIMPSGEKRWGHPCSCTCDIPFKDLKIHTARYKSFGIAFKKEIAIQRGFFNPVLYIHKNHYLFKYIENLLDELEKLTSSRERLCESLQEFLTILGTYVKPGDLLSTIHFNARIDEEQQNNFYYEREWRSAYEWKFNETDVAAIMLPQEYIKKFKEELGHEFSNVSIISAEIVETL